MRGAHKRKRALKGLLDREPQTILNRRRARKALVIVGHILGTGLTNRIIFVVFYDPSLTGSSMLS